MNIIIKAINELTFSIPFTAQLIISTIYIMRKNRRLGTIWAVVCTPLVIFFIGIILGEICSLHCISNMTVAESSEKNEIVCTEEIDDLYCILFFENDILQAITLDDIYDICKINDIENSPSVKGYAVKITGEYTSPGAIQKMASPAPKDKIRIYTNDSDLISRYEKNSSILAKTWLCITYGIIMSLFDLVIVIKFLKPMKNMD